MDDKTRELPYTIGDLFWTGVMNFAAGRLSGFAKLRLADKIIASRLKEQQGAIGEIMVRWAGVAKSPWIVEKETCDCGGEYPCGHKPYPYMLVSQDEIDAHWPAGKKVRRQLANFIELHNEGCDNATAEAIARAPHDIRTLLDTIGVLR